MFTYLLNVIDFTQQSLISLMFSVNVKHHVHFFSLKTTTDFIPSLIKHTVSADIKHHEKKYIKNDVMLLIAHVPAGVLPCK